MVWTVFLWILLGVFMFMLALALQMRVMIGVVIARALRARDKGLPIKESRLAVVKAGNGEIGTPEVDHILATWPQQISQLRLARRVSRSMPFLMLAVFFTARLMGKV